MTLPKPRINVVQQVVRAKDGTLEIKSAEAKGIFQREMRDEDHAAFRAKLLGLGLVRASVVKLPEGSTSLGEDAIQRLRKKYIREGLLKVGNGRYYPRDEVTVWHNH